MNTNTSGIIKIYNYTSDTHELIGSSDGYCDESTPLIPYCTMEQPPAAKHGYAITFDSASQEWSYHEDHRGAVVYDTKTGQRVIIERLGSLPSEVTRQPSTSDFDIWNGQSWEKSLQRERVALVSQAENLKKTLLVDATSTIAPLQDAVDLGMATDTEKSATTEWRKYRVLLNRVDCTTAPDIPWPEQPYR